MRAAPGRKALGAVAASLATIALGVTVGVLVAGPAAASSTTSATTTTGTGTGTLPSGADPNSPATRYFVINGTANAASDHERVGSSAFPNYSNGAVDNYYSMAQSHVDNSPFAQGTASPADTGPIGQTAAAGNFQQPQYADARWPGGPAKAAYGSQGSPYATAEAKEYEARAEASLASNGLSGGPGVPTRLAVPKGFDGRLRQALARWKTKWQGRLAPKAPTPTITAPAVPVPTPAGTVTTPTVTVGGLTPTPPSSKPAVSVPAPSVPSGPAPSVPSGLAPRSAAPSRSLSATSGDGASLLESTTFTKLDSKGALVTSGESRLKRVSIGGGQIVLEGIHVSATITNDGSPSEKVAVSVASATIGGVPVTIDQDGVHVAGQGQNLPYQQASDSLNGALKQAGIQIFMVTPEIERGSCDQSGTTTGGTTTSSSSTSTTTSSSDQTGSAPTGSCDQTGTPPTNPGLPTGTTTSTTSTTSTDQSGTTSTTSSCVGTGETTGSTTDGTTTTSTTSTTTGPGPGLPTGTTGTTISTTPSDPMGTGTGSGAGAETVTATGVHVVFTQPVAQAGVPSQNIEHILGEVFLDSLAVPAGPAPKLDLGLSSSCLGGSHSGTKGAKKSKSPGGASAAGGTGGGSPAGGSTSSGSAPSAASSFSGSSQPASGWSGSGAEPTSSSPGGLQAAQSAFVSALRKPLWLLVAYLLWQALVIATGASLWKWRKGGTS